MKYIHRRQFLISIGGATAAIGLPVTGFGKSGGARVVVVGGGFGGATCARYLRALDASLDVTLVTAEAKFVTCPFSNLVLGGMLDMASITHGYDGLKAAGVKVVVGRATAVDGAKREVKLANGDVLAFDRAVVSPGIDVKYGAIDGYNEKASASMPHAWQAGPQTELLRQQLTAMDDGGLVIIAAPANPFRCPPGPYERASLIAHYLKENKPKSKILLLDAKDKFSKQGLFMQGWEQLYPGMIEWVKGSQGGIVDRVDAGSNLLVTESGFTEHKGAVVNYIPPQQAASVARNSGLADDSGWCPVNQMTFESTQVPGVHVIGDASIAGKMPKSGFSANSQGKVCATAVAALLRGETPSTPSYANTCYSLVGPEYGISVSAVYRHGEKGIAGFEGAGGVSPADAGPEFREAEASYARGWYSSISADIWG